MRTMIIFSILMFNFCFGQSQKLSPLPKQLQGTIPNFKVLTIDKAEVSQNDLKAKAQKAGAKRIALSFFATWCKNCIEEFALLKDKAGELQENGVQVYLIDVGESINDVGGKAREIVDKHAGNSFSLYFDPNGNLLRKSGIIQEKSGKFSLPITFVLDADLRVVSVLEAVSKEDYPQVLWEEL